MKVVDKINGLRDKMNKESFEMAKELAAYDEEGKPTIRKISKETGKQFLKHPHVRYRCGQMIYSSARQFMIEKLNERIPEDASKLQRVAMAVSNGIKADVHANLVQARFSLDSSLLGYIINRAKERYGESKRNANLADLKARTDGKDYM